MQVITDNVYKKWPLVRLSDATSHNSQDALMSAYKTHKLVHHYQEKKSKISRNSFFARCLQTGLMCHQAYPLQYFVTSWGGRGHVRKLTALLSHGRRILMQISEILLIFISDETVSEDGNNFLI